LLSLDDAASLMQFDPQTISADIEQTGFDLESGCTFDLWADDVPICPIEVRNGETAVRPTPTRSSRKRRSLFADAP
jgi:hypothetical protein